MQFFRYVSYEMTFMVLSVPWDTLTILYSVFLTNNIISGVRILSVFRTNESDLQLEAPFSGMWTFIAGLRFPLSQHERF